MVQCFLDIASEQHSSQERKRDHGVQWHKQSKFHYNVFIMANLNRIAISKGSLVGSIWMFPCSRSAMRHTVTYNVPDLSMRASCTVMIPSEAEGTGQPLLPTPVHLQLFGSSLVGSTSRLPSNASYTRTGFGALPSAVRSLLQHGHFGRNPNHFSGSRKQHVLCER
jgi:hypothetical protein